jgi:hypothetical protein
MFELDKAPVRWRYGVSLFRNQEVVEQIDGSVRVGSLYCLVESKDQKGEIGNRSRAEGDKRTEAAQNRTSAMPASEETGRSDDGSGLGGERVRRLGCSGKSPAREQRIAAPLSAAHTPRSRREVHELPGEGTIGRFTPNCFGVSDRSAQSLP